MILTKNKDGSINGIFEETDMEMISQSKEIAKLLEKQKIIQTKLNALWALISGNIQMQVINAGMKDQVVKYTYYEEKNLMKINEVQKNPVFPFLNL